MSGVAMKVLTRAMITSIEKIFVGSSPRSLPMLRTISSIRARVFMQTPIVRALRCPSPTSRADIGAAELADEGQPQDEKEHREARPALDRADVGAQPRVGEEDRQEERP